MKAELLGLIGLFVLYFYMHVAFAQEEQQHERRGKCKFSKLVFKINNTILILPQRT